MAVRYRSELTSFRATQAAAQAAYAMAGFGPERVELAELHDAFSPFELISLEDTGLMPPGKAGRATLDGETALDGRLPVRRHRVVDAGFDAAGLEAFAQRVARGHRSLRGQMTAEVHATSRTPGHAAGAPEARPCAPGSARAPRRRSEDR